MHMRYDPSCFGTTTRSKAHSAVTGSTIIDMHICLIFSATNSLAFSLVRYDHCVTGRVPGFWLMRWEVISISQKRPSQILSNFVRMRRRRSLCPLGMCVKSRLWMEGFSSSDVESNCDSGFCRDASIVSPSSSAAQRFVVLVLIW